MARDTRNLNLICPNCFGTLNVYGYCQNCRTYAIPVAPSAAVLPAPTILLRRYFLGQCLGSGGFGISCLGWALETST